MAVESLSNALHFLHYHVGCGLVAWYRITCLYQRLLSYFPFSDLRFNESRRIVQTLMWLRRSDWRKLVELLSSCLDNLIHHSCDNITRSFVIWGFRGGVKSSLFLGVTQHRLVTSYRRFGTTYRSQLQGSSSERCSSRRTWTVWTLKMGPICCRCPETSVTNNLRCVTSQKSEDRTYPLLDYSLISVNNSCQTNK